MGLQKRNEQKRRLINVWPVMVDPIGLAVLLMDDQCELFTMGQFYNMVGIVPGKNTFKMLIFPLRKGYMSGLVRVTLG